jgi:hypothetical protein
MISDECGMLNDELKRPGNLKQFEELIDTDAGITDQSPQEAAIQGSMVRDRQIYGNAGLGKDHMAASLAIENPSGFFKGPAGLATADDWELGHAASRIK